jgi:hypothetical protein
MLSQIFSVNKETYMSMITTSENDQQVEHDEIAKLAKRFWESEGRPVGRDLEYWLRAEQAVRSSRRRGNHLPGNGAAVLESRQRRKSRNIKLPDSSTKLAHT